MSAPKCEECRYFRQPPMLLRLKTGICLREQGYVRMTMVEREYGACGPSGSLFQPSDKLSQP